MTEHEHGVRLIGGPCDGWTVQWLSGPVAYFMREGDIHPHGYYLADDGAAAVWQVDALRDHMNAR